MDVDLVAGFEDESDLALLVFGHGVRFQGFNENQEGDCRGLTVCVSRRVQRHHIS